MSVAKVEDNTTIFQTLVPNRIKSEFEDWNFGHAYHMGHMIQIEPSSFLVEKGLSHYVEEAGKPAPS
jgi:hypothetical protein